MIKTVWTVWHIVSFLSEKCSQLYTAFPQHDWSCCGNITVLLREYWIFPQQDINIFSWLIMVISWLQIHTRNTDSRSMWFPQQPIRTDFGPVWYVTEIPIQSYSRNTFIQSNLISATQISIDFDLIWYPQQLIPIGFDLINTRNSKVSLVSVQFDTRNS